MTIVCVHVQWVSKTPLQYAAGGGHVVVVKALLAAGANVNAQIDVSAPWLGWKACVSGRDARGQTGSEYSMTALHFATMGGHAEIVEMLLAAGASVNIAAKCEVSASLFPARRCARGLSSDLLCRCSTANAKYTMPRWEGTSVLSNLWWQRGLT